MTTRLTPHLAAAVEQLRANGRYRYLENSSSAQAVRIVIDGRDYINFCSNDYLGLCNHQALKAAAIEAVENYGVGAGAAQLLSGRHELHAQLEQALAAFTGYDAALIFSSGYLANIGLISALVSRHDVVHQDKLNHASLIDAIKLSGASSKRFPHGDMNVLEAGLIENAERQQWVVTDSVFSMDGDLAPLDVMSDLTNRYSANLIVDDAHGIGVLAGGRGARAHFKLSTQSLPITVVTFGKALGTQGAAVLGNKQLIEYLVQACRTYIYDTAPPPAITAATLAAVNLIRDDTAYIRRLDDNIHLFRKLCRDAAIELGDSNTPIQPLMLGDEVRALRAAEFLREKGLYLRAVRPPTVPKNTARLRICISAAHEKQDIEYLVDKLATFLNHER